MPVSEPVEDNAPTDLPKRDWRSIASAWLHLLLAALLIATLASFGARTHWLLELFVHFKLVYVTLASGVGIGLLATKRSRSATLCALLFVLHAPGIFVWYIPSSANTDRSSQGFSVLLANVLSSNPNHGAVVSYIREHQPDVALIQEVNPEWMTSLKALSEDGYQVVAEARFDNFGMAALTRLPAAEISTVDLTKFAQMSGGPTTVDSSAALIRDIPVMQLKLKVGEREIGILNLHPLPPIGSSYAIARNRMLSLASEYANSADDLVIIAGDLNVTPWSPAYKDAFDTEVLVNTRRGFGIYPTYPSIGTLFLIIPIDHILISPDIRVTKLKYTPEWGSDHTGLWVELAIPTE